MPRKQPDPQKELTILLQSARRNSRNPLLVKVVDWTGYSSSPFCCLMRIRESARDCRG
jgi:hypothetical protein